MDHERHRAPVADTERKYNDNYCKLFVGGLTPATTVEMLRNFYSQFGEVLDCVVKRDRITDRPRGFGFVTLSSKEEVDKAMDARPHEIDGRTVDPKRAASRSEESVVTTILFVSNLRPEFTKEDLEQYFSKYGKVLKVVIPLDKIKNESRGFAFVTFEDYDAVDKCVLEESHTIRNYPCYVKKDNKDVQQKVAYNRMKRTAPWNESYGMPMKRGDRYGSWQHGPTSQWKHGAVPTSFWSPYGGYVPPPQNSAMPSYAYTGYVGAVPPNTMSQSWYQGGQFNNQSAAVVPNAMVNSPAGNAPWYAYTASAATSKNPADIPAAPVKLESNGGI